MGIGPGRRRLASASLGATGRSPNPPRSDAGSVSEGIVAMFRAMRQVENFVDTAHRTAPERLTPYQYSLNRAVVVGRPTRSRRRAAPVDPDGNARRGGMSGGVP